MVRSTSGGTSAVLPVLTVFIICCVLFSGVLFALQTDESPVTKSPVTEVPAAEAVAAEQVAESTAEEVKDPAALKLEETLKKNSKCLRCHKRDKTKLLEDGKEMSIQVHQEGYLASAHGEVSCVSCHRAIGNRKHPSKKTNITIASERQYNVEMNDSCRKCHMQKFKQYKGSVHSALVAQGSDKAPVCTSCHNPHAPVSMANYQAETGLPCKNCHENILDRKSHV